MTRLNANRSRPEPVSPLMAMGLIASVALVFLAAGYFIPLALAKGLSLLMGGA